MPSFTAAAAAVASLPTPIANLPTNSKSALHDIRNHPLTSPCTTHFICPTADVVEAPPNQVTKEAASFMIFYLILLRHSERRTPPFTRVRFVSRHSPPRYVLTISACSCTSNPPLITRWNHSTCPKHLDNSSSTDREPPLSPLLIPYDRSAAVDQVCIWDAGWTLAVCCSPHQRIDPTNQGNSCFT